VGKRVEVNEARRGGLGREFGLGFFASVGGPCMQEYCKWGFLFEKGRKGGVVFLGTENL